MMTTSCLLKGKVMHHRLDPVGHRFTYTVPSFLIDLDELPSLGLKLLSHNRLNMFSIYDKDVGDGGNPRAWIESLLPRYGIAQALGSVKVHLFGRVFGLGFSPLTTWFCYDTNRQLMAVLYEVHNTFGEKHGYLAKVDDPHLKTFHHSADKCFHVSPFIGPAGRYDFTLKHPDNGVSIAIKETDLETGRTILIATHMAKPKALTDGALLRAALAYPLLPLKIIGGIHWEALWLWLKGAPFYTKPNPPENLVSLIDSGKAP